MSGVDGDAPQLTAMELEGGEGGVGVVTWARGQLRRSGQRGLAGSAVPAAFIKPSLSDPPPSSCSPFLSWGGGGRGKGWGGTLAAGKVERAVQSPVTCRASVKTSGGSKPARREGYAGVGSLAPTIFASLEP